MSEIVEEIILLSFGLSLALLAANCFVNHWVYAGAYWTFAALWWLRYHGPSK